ncbi:hypothetical protein HNQ59_000791 [Chitinivorax tropicus]|uniref:Uncharacterized protein n=1 Tax=Chitinivorax tropicus TaxID=714531 RepID=A0A840MLD3_9PROT|nr:hypothetical protein [Chitinivorax tropicus]
MIPAFDRLRCKAGADALGVCVLIGAPGCATGAGDIGIRHAYKGERNSRGSGGRLHRYSRNGWVASFR